MDEIFDLPVHLVDENPEDHLGEKMPDPWDDPYQTDWSNSEENDR